MKPASRSMLSDWYPENSDAALTKERKQTKERRSMARGKMLMVRRTEAKRPVQAMAVRAWLLLENQSRVGAYQKRAKPTELVTARRYSGAGRIPLEPIRPRTWKIREKKAEK